MDAATYLKRQGWRGDGHSLDHTGRGIRKPLLVSKKVDVLGVGLNKHAAVSDQWWMRAFDQGLKDLGTGKRTALADVREKGMNYGGLYGRFVKGEGVPGTFDEEEKAKSAGKRKREESQEEEHKSLKKVKTGTKALQKELSRNVRRFVDEAVQRGLISKDTDDTTIKKRSSQSASAKYGEKAVANVFKQAGLETGGKTKERDQQDKYDRGKLVRAVKRAAKRYLLDLLSPEDRQALELNDEEGKRKDEKSTEEEDANDEKSKAKAAKALRKQEKKGRKLAVKDGFESNTDEIKLAAASQKKSKSIPGVGTVERYPTKAEKKAKKRQSQKENLMPTPPADENRDEGAESSSSSSNVVGFTVDTQGDNGLGGRDPLSVIDSDGHVRYTCKPNEAVPLDPTIWIGIKPKLLPKPVREARTEYMSRKREARQARKAKKGKS